MLSVLLIEDGYWDRIALEERLKLAGARVKSVYTVEEAINIVRHYGKRPNRFQGIVSDVNKRGQNGLDLLNWINKYWLGHPRVLLHSTVPYYDEVDLDALNFHISGRVTFRLKARVMDGADEDAYKYITEFVRSIETDDGHKR